MLKEEVCVLVHPEVLSCILRYELVFEIDAEKVEIGLKEPTFWTLLTVKAKFVVPLVTSSRIFGGTIVHPVQLAEESPNSVGKVVVSIPVGIPDGATSVRSTDTVALFWNAEGTAIKLIKLAAVFIVTVITPWECSTAHPW